MYLQVFEILNTLVMYLNANMITNIFSLNVFEILSNTLKEVFKYFKYKYFMYLTPIPTTTTTTTTTNNNNRRLYIMQNYSKLSNALDVQN